MKKNILAILILLNLSPTVFAAPFYSISLINQKHITEGTFETAGYVIFVSYCPPCPKEAVCAPCPMPFIVISEKNRKIQYVDEIAADELMISNDRGEELKVGRKYRFKIKIDSFKMLGEQQNNMRLLEFAPVQSRAPKSKPSK